MCMLLLFLLVCVLRWTAIESRWWTSSAHPFLFRVSDSGDQEGHGARDRGRHLHGVDLKGSRDILVSLLKPSRICRQSKCRDLLLIHISVVGQMLRQAAESDLEGFLNVSWANRAQSSDAVMNARTIPPLSRLNVKQITLHITVHITLQYVPSQPLGKVKVKFATKIILI